MAPSPALPWGIAALVCLLVACGRCGGPAPAGDAPPAPDAGRENVPILTRGVSAMGTLFEITVAGGGDGAEEAIEAAFDEIRRVESLLTTWDPASPLSRVNARAGKGAVEVPGELLDVVEEALAVSRATGGAFDVSFAAMSGLWDFGAARPSLPDRAEIERRLSLIDYRRVRVDRERGTLALEREGMRVSLGGIAKGWGIDRAAAVLEERGVTDFRLFGGGDLLVSGDEGGRPWVVGVRDPRRPGRNFARIEMDRYGAVVTSGDYEKCFVLEGKRYHHIIDPRTGWPARGTVSATVVASSATVADGFATGLFAMGPQEAMALAEGDLRIDVLLVDEELGIAASTGLESRVSVSPIAPSEEGSE